MLQILGTFNRIHSFGICRRQKMGIQCGLESLSPLSSAGRIVKTKGALFGVSIS